MYFHSVELHDRHAALHLAEEVDRADDKVSLELLYFTRDEEQDRILDKCLIAKQLSHIFFFVLFSLQNIRFFRSGIRPINDIPIL